jgi:hypothetical protein
MFDLEIHLDHRPGALAEMGEALGKADISIEGGGAFTVDNRGYAHFLFEDGKAAQVALEKGGIQVSSCRKVLIQKLNQEEPGQLGKLTRLMAEAGVSINVIYSDHDNQLILVVDDYSKGLEVSESWRKEKKHRVR